MSSTWVVVVAVGLATVGIKAAGPVLLGGRGLPKPLASMVKLLAPAVLAALVVTQTFADGRALVLDARVLGVVAAVVALRLRAPILAVVVVAAAATALARALS